MGLTWIGEVIAYILSQEAQDETQGLTIALNLPNLLQGVIVFLVFGLKARVWRGLKQNIQGRPPSSNSMRENSSAQSGLAGTLQIRHSPTTQISLSWPSSSSSAGSSSARTSTFSRQVSFTPSTDGVSFNPNPKPKL